MTIRQRLSTVLPAALLCLAVVGCHGSPDAATTDDPDAATAAAADSAAGTFIGRQAAEAVSRASRDLETGNIRLGEGMRFTVDGRSHGSDGAAHGLPLAEITPAGELLIEGEAVPTTPEQKALLLEHRGHVVGVARSGMALGVQGAEIAGAALTGIGQAMFGGDEGRKAYEARVEASAEGMKQEALKLCARLPALYDSQEALAASLPAFAPYATMEREDIDECGREVEDVIDAGAADAVRA